MLQYALLHLFGYAVSLDDLKNFRVSGPLELPDNSLPCYYIIDPRHRQSIALPLATPRLMIPPVLR